MGEPRSCLVLIEFAVRWKPMMAYGGNDCLSRRISSPHLRPNRDWHRRDVHEGLGLDEQRPVRGEGRVL
jgi:hypothetical protein